jgi:hypothetical protein
VIVGAIESEDQVEDNTAEVAGSASQARDDTVVGRMYMRHDSKIGAITSFSENGSYGEGSNQAANIAVWDRSDAN